MGKQFFAHDKIKCFCSNYMGHFPVSQKLGVQLVPCSFGFVRYLIVVDKVTKISQDRNAVYAFHTLEVLLAQNTHI